MKRGQVTVFIILGVVILSSVAVVLLLKDEDIESLPVDTNDVNSFVNRCLKDTSDGAVIAIGSRGGFYALPETSNYHIKAVPYYYYNSKLVPTKEGIEEELSNYISDNVDNCFNDFSDFENVDYNSIEVNTRVLDSSVVVDLNTDISVVKENSSVLLENFDYEVKTVRIPKILTVANDLVDEIDSTPDKICLECVDQIALENNVFIDLQELEDSNNFLYTITDPESNFSGQSYEFNFATRYKFGGQNA